ncbi:MAG: DUF3179 domain-containing protein [Planctomycetes bacterium]|nr:DUF3179 domain-containing protein [Planctomycetota bacterium]
MESGPRGKRIKGFDLSFSLIPVKEILSGGVRKDGIPALTKPKVVKGVDAKNLKPGEPVIGVTIGEVNRVYPIKILEQHEIVNDVVGGVPILVSYCPLCRSALVFERKIGGEVLEFGVSGLLWNSNVLMYDRRAKSEQESLWSQVKMGAVTGPAARKGLKLKLLPSRLTSWESWRKDHKATTVLSEQTGHSRRYSGIVYGRYFGTDELMFPVKLNGKRPGRFQNKEPMILVQTGEKSKAYAIADIALAVQGRKQGVFEDTIGQERVRLRYDAKSQSVQAETAGAEAKPIPVAYLFWFSLNAILPDVPIYEPSPVKPGSGKTD